MKELSLNILDIVENSVKAGASLTEILIDETDSEIKITIADNGCGMTKEILESVTNPFYTTRTTRKVGMGLPLLKMEAEQTGGEVTVDSKSVNDSPDEHGTKVCALFNKGHIDCIPLGDTVSSIITLIQGHPDTDFLFRHNICDKRITLDTRELRQILGDVPLNTYEVISWIREYLSEQYS